MRTLRSVRESVSSWNTFLFGYQHEIHIRADERHDLPLVNRFGSELDQDGIAQSHQLLLPLGVRGGQMAAYIDSRRVPVCAQAEHNKQQRAGPDARTESEHQEIVKHSAWPRAATARARRPQRQSRRESPRMAREAWCARPEPVRTPPRVSQSK